MLVIDSKYLKACNCMQHALDTQPAHLGNWAWPRKSVFCWYTLHCTAYQRWHLGNHSEGVGSRFSGRSTVSLIYFRFIMSSMGSKLLAFPLSNWRIVAVMVVRLVRSHLGLDHEIGNSGCSKGTTKGSKIYIATLGSTPLWVGSIAPSIGLYSFK